MSANPLVSVVILSWNRRDELRKTLQQLRQVIYDPLEIIVVDNHSTDGTQEMVGEEIPHVRLIALPKNMGVAGWNEGFANANGKYILALDDDAHPMPHAVQKAVRLLEADEKIGIAACNVVNVTTCISETWWPKGLPVASGLEEVSFVGAGVFIRRSIIQHVGGFIDMFFLYQEELEFSTRVLAASYSIRLEENIIVCHRASPLWRTSMRRVFFQERNTILYFLLHFRVATAMRKTIGALRRVAVQAFQLQNVMLPFKVAGSVVHRLPEVLRRRRPVSQELAGRILSVWPMSETHEQRRYSVQDLTALDHCNAT